MKKFHLTILAGEILSYTLIIVFIFADSVYDLTEVLGLDQRWFTPRTALVAACLIGLVGAINVWMTWNHLQRARAIRECLVVCAWSNRVKRDGQWIPLSEFLDKELGYQVSHGLSDPALLLNHKDRPTSPS